MTPAGRAAEGLPAEILAAVWREVSRHLDIAGSAASLLAVVQEVVPARWLLVRRWDAARARLDSVAYAGPVGLDEGWEHRTPAPTPLQRTLLGWADAASPAVWGSRGETSLGRLLVPEGAPGPVGAVPLLGAEGLVGVALVGGTVRAAHLRALAEPLAVALANDQRLHDMERLREAADADRRALLTRLGREDVSDAIVGADAGLAGVLQRVGQVAPTDAPVLLLGETGSGKEVVARAIHRGSLRHDAPFVRVNCGAIPAELVDSELFGHERGAFTGAVKDRRGWFERADGGTLFLDEIGELPAAAQVRLLRVLQDGTFQRVGGEPVHSADVRVVAATHRDLGAMVRSGAFRQDLWYRVSVFPIRLPSLRERRGDVAALVEHFAARAGTRLVGHPIAPTADDVHRLAAREWPGNVRELAAVVERAAILGGGRALDLEAALGAHVGEGGEAAAGGTDAERIVTALERCRGRIEGPFGAAVALGVNPFTLRSRMRRLGIDWSRYRRSG